MELKTEIYSKIEITYTVYSNGRFSAYAFDGGISTEPDYFYTLSDAQKDIKNKIDSFLSSTPKDYRELIKAIQNASSNYDVKHEMDEFIEYDAFATIMNNFLSYISGGDIDITDINSIIYYKKNR